MDSYELSLVCPKDKSNKSWDFASASELFHAHEIVIMFISAEEKKKSLLRGKKIKKEGGLKARATPERGGKKHQEHKAIPSRTLARNSPWKSFPFITEC